MVRPPSPARTLLAYVLMLAATVGLFLFVRSHGEALPSPAAVAAPASAAPVASTANDLGLAHVLLAIAAIVVVARLVGRAFERFLRQPPVMGEIVAGILLGPSFFGALSPRGYAFLLPASAVPQLRLVAQIGVALFMFLVGLELDPRELRKSSHTTLAISHTSILAPFALGSTLALVLFPIYGRAGTSFTVFALFIGVSMSVTAFPVLARILTDRRLQQTRVGATAIAAAAAGDVTAWCLLAFVSGLARGQASRGARTIALMALYVAVMIVVVRPIARWLAAREESTSTRGSPTTLAMVLALLFASASATEWIGLHSLFGAFFFGALLPHEGKLAERVRSQLHDVVVVLLLPIFFAFTGMRTQFGLVSTAADGLLCAAIIGVATVGKFGGSLAAARFGGFSWGESSAIGVLMNTRGLMELIVLDVGLDMGVLSPTLFAMLVLMALVTTFATTPVLDLLSRTGSAARSLGLGRAPAPNPPSE